MRLKPGQISALITSLAPYLKKEKAELYLFGSRTNDQLKGGDIDLLLLIDKEELATYLNQEKHYILSSIKKLIGDQKIDLVIASKNQAVNDNFIKLILPQSEIMWTN